MMEKGRKQERQSNLIEAMRKKRDAEAGTRPTGEHAGLIERARAYGRLDLPKEEKGDD
jgi:hypothetical protein